MNQKCKRVFIIGLDGAGNTVKDVDTPNINKLLAKGTVTYEAQTAVPTISGECWGSMLHGVPPEKHMLTNEIVSKQTYPEDSLYPSIFKLARHAWPECELAGFSCWSPINSGIIEESAKCYLKSTSDDNLAPIIAEYILTHDPKLLFVQFDEIDASGHKYGYRSPEYYDQIKKTDKNVGIIIDAIERTDMMKDSLIIISSDHGGGGESITNHGADHPLDKTIFWGCSGPGIKSKTVIKSEVHIMDTAPVAAYALGLKTPKTWEGKVPNNLFVD
ncbi:MAG: alkaline phosphatase family protein [Vallitalea sp.]|jgi:predicted AlkP superfamily pyrophosphatase or phosphodiesterase|nr:alkaline phosphatase family protein [Vallitalea sp.]